MGAKQPPSGIVTALFSDIEGSTALVQKLGDDSVALFERHRALLRTAFERHGGFEQATEGDGFFVVFAQPADAVAAALDAQLALAAEPWPEGSEIRVRIGIHTGVAAWRDGDYWGIGIHEAARIGAVGHGGQTIVSETTATAADQTLPEDVSLLDLGLFRLKDLAEPRRLFQLKHSELCEQFPPLRTLDFHEHNLPTQRTPLLGRDGLLVSLHARLAAERLITLTGVGGTGKTRLALQLAANHVQDFRDGVFFVDLAVTTDPELVAVTVARAMSMPSQVGSDGDALADLIAYTTPRQVLLLLDNCEHLLDAVSSLCDALLEHSTGVTLLVTSREPLGVEGETVVRVPSLEESDAVQLFRDRAARAGTLIDETAATNEHVRQIVRRLDGVPLAIELAAARCVELPVGTIAELLDDRFRVLTGGTRKSQQRHQTLLATVEWSHNLLSEAEQRTFRRLSVFPGGFTASTAAAVCGEGDVVGTAEVLGSLVKKSLVGFDNARYRLLETLRLFAEGRLADAAEADEYRARHADWVARAAAELTIADTDAILLLLDDARAALAWCEGAGEYARGVRVVGAAASIWFAFTISDEVAPWFDRARAIDESLDYGDRLAWRYAEHWAAINALDVSRMQSVGDELAALDPHLQSAAGAHSAWLRAVITGWFDPEAGLAQLDRIADAPGWEHFVGAQFDGDAGTVANARAGFHQIAGRFEEAIAVYESVLTLSGTGSADYNRIDYVVALALAGRAAEAIAAGAEAMARLHPWDPHFSRPATEAAYTIALAASSDLAAAADRTLALFDLLARDYAHADSARAFVYASSVALCRFAGQCEEGMRILAAVYHHGYIGRWLGAMGLFRSSNRIFREALGERRRELAAEAAAMSKDELFAHARSIAERLANA